MARKPFSAWIAGLTLAMAAMAAAAAPPPPAPFPAALPKTFDGYDLEVPYQRWRYWVEGRKGEAIEALLAKPDAVAGETPYGAPLLRFAGHGDLGQFVGGEVRAYCRPRQPYGFEPGSCHYRLRRVFVEPDAGAFSADNPVARWTRESFDPAKLAPQWRKAGLGPDTDWWMTDLAKMFAASPSPVAMLIENATVVRADSRDCPALGREIEALDRKTLDVRLDFLAVGEDAALTPPPPHAGLFVYKLRLLAPGPGAAVSIEGRSPAIEALVLPVLAAAETCARAARP